MANTTRFKGAYDSEVLSIGDIKSRDMIQSRHDVRLESDADKGIPFELVQAIPVCVCTSAAGTTTKTAAMQESFSDFSLINGREIICYMLNANTASNPMLNVAGTGAILLEITNWKAGCFLHLRYVDITVAGNRIQRWLVISDAVNGILANYGTKTDLANYGKQYTNDANNVNESVCKYNADTLNSPFNLGVIDAADGLILSCFTEDKNWGAQFCLCSGNRKIFQRFKGGGNWFEWQELVLKSEVGKYYDYIPNALDIGDFRNGYCSNVSINIPYNFAWGVREVKVISENQAIAILTGVTNDGVNHHWINIYNFGNWSGWQDTIN